MADWYEHFNRIRDLYFRGQIFFPEDGDSKFLRNVSIYLTISHNIPEDHSLHNLSCLNFLNFFIACKVFVRDMNVVTLQKEMLFPSAKTKHVKFKLCWKMEHCLCAFKETFEGSWVWRGSSTVWPLAIICDVPLCLPVGLYQSGSGCTAQVTKLESLQYRC